MDTVIEHQKRVAYKVLDKLRLIDPEAVVVGGAPRNWYFGKPANDVDIYLRWQEDIHYPETGIMRRLSSLLEAKVLHKSPQEDYDSAYLKAVFEFNLEGINFDVMYIRQDITPASVYDFFDSSICQIFWNDYERSNEIDCYRSHEFRECEKKKVIKFIPDTDKDSKHFTSVVFKLTIPLWACNRVSLLSC